jgi:hopanoid biosynthesis associated protein HpnK
MASADSPRRLIVNADDFGRSHSINLAVIQAHQNGILTTASLMVAEPGFEEAVHLARQNPRLGIGLHLALSHGRSVLPNSELPGLVDPAGHFSNSPGLTGFRYFANHKLHPQLRKEIRAQFDKFRGTGLPMDHLNGHLHFHMHPTVFKFVMELAAEFNIRAMRLTNEPLSLDRRISSGNWFYRLSHALIYRQLSANSRPWLKDAQIRHTSHVFGLLQNAKVTENYILKLLPLLPPGDSELYSHPSLDEFRHEYDALLSNPVKLAIQNLGIKLIRYQDL